MSKFYVSGPAYTWVGRRVPSVAEPFARKFTNVDYINNDLITARWTKSFGNRQISRRFF